MMVTLRYRLFDILLVSCQLYENCIFILLLKGAAKHLIFRLHSPTRLTSLHLVCQLNLLHGVKLSCYISDMQMTIKVGYIQHVE